MYAVPGSPVVAERTVALLHERSRTGAVGGLDALEVVIVPGLSFAELAWARLGVDPLDGARVVDGRDFSVDAPADDGPLLVAQCDSPFVLSDVKLQLLERLDPATPVVVLQRLGLPGEHVATVPLETLDRDVTPDHLTAVFVAAPAASAATELTAPAGAGAAAAAAGRLSVGRRADAPLARPLPARGGVRGGRGARAPPARRAPGAAGDPEYVALVDELGDLLYQIVFHVILAEEAGAFSMAEVARGIHDKLVRRHPHVFGDAAAGTGDDVLRNWEQIKKEEKGHDSLVAGLTPGLPSLLYTHKLYRKAASVGLDPGGLEPSVARVHAAADAIAASPSEPGAGAFESALGELLAAAVALSRTGGVDAESALRGWAGRFRERFERFEVIARERGLDLGTLDPEGAAALWEEAAAPRPT